jgi:8-oxo-dGTP pyrophosphatase MutT (NUDIX family)
MSILLCAVSEPIAANPRPAATVVVLRDSPAGPQVFMVRRHEDTAFMGGAHVFPGGRVDAADRAGVDRSWCTGMDAAAAQLGDLPPADAIGFHVAALRELFEEAGVLLARDASGAFVPLVGDDVRARFKQYRADVHDAVRSLRDVISRERLTLALDALVVFAHWVTPPIDVRQFDTRFFLTRVPPDQTPAHDDTETTHSVWITPAEAIAHALRDEIVLPPPTWTTLRELEPFHSVDEALAWARRCVLVRRMPHHIVDEAGRRLLLLPGDPLHPEASDHPPAETRFVHLNGRWRAQRSGA